VFIRRIQQTAMGAVLLTLAFGAAAQSREVGVVQAILQQLGIEVGKLDGKLGPKTIAGLRRYSEAYGGAADVISVRLTMERLNEQNRRPVEDEKLIAEVEAAVREELLDPESARFRNLYFAPNPVGPDSRVCGEVNAKNRFGGYVGFNDFGVDVSNLDFTGGNNPEWRVFNVALATGSDTWRTDLHCRLFHPPKMRTIARWRRLARRAA